MKTGFLPPFASLFLLPLAVAHGQRDFSNVEIKVVPVAQNIYMLEGAGGNIGVSVGEDGILIVDDQFAPLAGKIEAALRNLNPGKLRFVLNTHFHGDHVGGNAHFSGAGATIVAHQNVRNRLASDAGNARAALPVITFEQSASIHFNGEEIRLLHHGPGHTDGDSVIHFTGSNVVHTGDLFFNGRFPYVDIKSGGSVDGYLKRVETVLQQVRPDTRIIPGHGAMAGTEDLKKFRDMIVETTGVVKQAITAGKTLEQVKAAGLPDKWSAWGSGFINSERWLETIYNDATGK